MKLAQRRKTTPHALMLEAISEKLDAEEARARFLAEGNRRLAKMKKAGSGISAQAVFEYFEKRARGERARRPRLRKIG
ncbi:MAG: hypothetical protein EPO20_14110 [Betaproteobacteria bacterium]|nr:MAG: hypothetical protein EPO20_14110 [Betaproteobacteria bacterium]